MSLKNRHEWNWQPTLPIKLSPILDWPPNFLLLFKWLASYWLHISSIIIEVLLGDASGFLTVIFGILLRILLPFLNVDFFFDFQ